MADFADEKTHPRVPSDYATDKEKHQSDESVRDAIHATDIDTNEHFTTGDPFPIDPLIPEEEYQLTVRAIVIGCALGAIVGASNIYLGLKTGFTFGPQLFGAIFGYAIIKPLSRAIGGNSLPGWLWGGNFGPKENVCVQTAATSAGGLGILFVSGVPAMYRLGLMSYTPDQDFGKLISLTIASCYFGVAFAIPLRKYFIIHQKLVFPTPTATAFTIRSLHDGVTGAIVARKKSLGLLVSFAAVFTFKIATGYLPGIIYDWHIGWTLYRLGWNSIIALENYNWWIEFTPAFFGAGMLSGINASWSFFGGCILAWGIIAPALVAQGIATTVSISDEYPLKSVNALKFATPDDYIHAASPRYHLLWPGVLIMLVYSFVELFMSSRSLMGGVGAGFGKLRARIDRFRNRNDPNFIQPEYVDSDPAPLEDRVPNWAWIGVLIVSIILAISLTSTQFGLGVGELILALLLSFLFSFIGVQSAGDTDINPVSTVAKASQLIFGGVSKGQGMEQMKAEKLNLVAGVVAAGAAAQATDMTGDFKTGHLLRAKPKVQFVAQLAGSTVASFLTVGLFVLFTKASPCILYPAEDGNCTYGAPSVAAWAAVATAVTSPTLPIPRVSGIIAICLSVAAAITVVVKHLFIPKKYWMWVPNWNAVGLGFVLPQTYYSTAMAAGSVFCWWWEHRSPAHFDMYMYPVSAGLLAGEGLGGVVQALLQVAGVAGDGVKYGTSVGCPGFEFCG